MAKDKETIEKIDFNELVEPSKKIIHVHEKDYWLPVLSLIIIGSIGLGLVFLYFKMLVPLDVFNSCVPQSSSATLLDSYFKFQKGIMNQILQIGSYIYAPLVPIFAIIIWNYIKK